MQAISVAGPVATSVPLVPDIRNIRKELLAKWRGEIKPGPLPRKVAWLESEEAVIALGAREREVQLSRTKRDLDRCSRRACSWFWALAAARNDPIPDGMALSRVAIRIGEDGRPSQRLTPRPAVEVEDLLDGMTEGEAYFYNYPRSPSAAVIQEIASREARPISGRW